MTMLMLQVFIGLFVAFIVGLGLGRLIKTILYTPPSNDSGNPYALQTPSRLDQPAAESLSRPAAAMATGVIGLGNAVATGALADNADVPPPTLPKKSPALDDITPPLAEKNLEPELSTPSADFDMSAPKIDIEPPSTAIDTPEVDIHTPERDAQKLWRDIEGPDLAMGIKSPGILVKATATLDDIKQLISENQTPSQEPITPLLGQNDFLKTMEDSNRTLAITLKSHTSGRIANVLCEVLAPHRVSVNGLASQLNEEESILFNDALMVVTCDHENYTFTRIFD